MRPTALVVEDSVAAAGALTAALLALNISVEVVLNGSDAWTVLKSEYPRFDLVFVSTVLDSGEDGGDLLLRIKSDYLVSNTLVIMMSPVVDSSLAAFYSKHGAELVIYKPVDLSAVLDVCRQYRFDDHSVTIPNHDAYSSNPLRSSGQLQLGDVAPPFSLADADSKVANIQSLLTDHREYVRHITVLVFVPSIFCTYLYENESRSISFLPSLAEDYWVLLTGESEMIDTEEISVRLYCISGDLPSTLAAAKKEFNLPFELLSDPLLQVARQFVGTANTFNTGIGCSEKQSAVFQQNSNVADSFHLKQWQRAAILGYVCIDNASGKVAFKWVAEHANTGVLDYSLQSPSLKSVIAELSQSEL
jgi:peroxiredoxin